MAGSLITSGVGFPMFDDFRKDVDTLMQRFFDGGRLAERASSQWIPRINLSETDKQYEVSVELPGMKPDDFEVEIRNGDLWISGERQSETEESGKTWHRVEQSYGQFRRAIRLGDDVDAEHVSAEYKDGVLHVTVPKAENARTRRVTVKS